MTIRSCIATLLLTPLAALAQTTTPPAEPAPAAPAPAATPESAKPAPWYSTVTFGGTVDAYYLVRLDAAQDTPLTNRAFDTASGFNLGYAKVSAAMAPSPAGFRLDLGFGPAAGVISPDTGPGVTSPASSGISSPVLGSIRSGAISGRISSV